MKSPKPVVSVQQSLSPYYQRRGGGEEERKGRIKSEFYFCFTAKTLSPAVILPLRETPVELAATE